MRKETSRKKNAIPLSPLPLFSTHHSIRHYLLLVLTILLRTHSVCGAWHDSPDAAAEVVFNRIKTIKFVAIHNPYTKIKGVKAFRYVREALKESLKRRSIPADLLPPYLQEKNLDKQGASASHTTFFSTRFRHQAVIQKTSWNVFEILTYLLHAPKEGDEGGYHTYHEAKKDGWTLSCLDALEGAILLQARKDPQLLQRIDNPSLQEQLEELLGVYGTPSPPQEDLDEPALPHIASMTKDIQQQGGDQTDSSSQKISLEAGTALAGALVASLLARKLSHIREGDSYLKKKQERNKKRKKLTSDAC